MSYISDYLNFTSNTESPLDYHKWSCLASLSVLAGRRFWFKLGPITYYPNLYVVLVGHPGVKKSSAMDRAKDIIRDVNKTGACKIPIAAAQATKEFIARAMSHEKFPGKRYFKATPTSPAEEYNQYAIFATELTQFIGVNPIGMLDFLTTVYTEKVYDCDTKGQGSDLVVGPYITMLACLTPEMLKGFLKMNILTGGFARRTIFVYGSQGQIVPIPGETPEQIAARERCVKWGAELQQYAGEFVFGPGAQEWYENWYRELHTNMTDIAKPSTEGYFRTKHEILFKTSMLIALSENFKPILEVGHFEIAEKRFLKPIEQKLELVFEGAGINPNAAAATQICRMLESMDRPMGYKYILALFGDQATSYRELAETIDHLVMVGRLKKRSVTADGNLLGDVIGTPESVARYSDADLAEFLKRPVGPQHPSYTDSSQEAHPPETPDDQPQG